VSQPGVTDILCRCVTCFGSFEQKSGLPRCPLPPPDLFLWSGAGRGKWFLGEVGYVYVIGVWCGKWVLIIVGRKLGWGRSVGIFG